MSNVPTNLIPTRITGLPEYTGTSTLGYMAYIIDGRTYKVQFSNIAAVGAVPSSRVIATGNGLEGGGDLSENRTISIISHGVGYSQLDFTGVTAGTYGSADTIPALTIDATGRVTAAVNTPVVLSNYVPSSRTITAGAGLTGGGQLNNNITIALNPSNATPQSLGVAFAGTGTQAARDDHVHPAVNLTDTSETQGVLPLGRGGTGVALSPVVGAVIYADNDSLNQTIAGNAGQILKSAGGLGAPYWDDLLAGGTVTSVSVVSANGLAGTVANPTSTPAITLRTTVTGVVKGDGTALSAASAGTDYVAPGAITTSGLTMATDRLLGRTTATTGAVEEITVGTGLSLSAGSLTNSAPDQVVSLTGAGTTVVTGTYPSFTITSNDQYVGTVTSVGLSGGTTGLTVSGTNPITTSGTFTLGGTLVAANGGTGIASYTAGDLLYASGSTALSKLGIGSNTFILTSTGSTPQWSNPTGVTVGTATNLAGGASGSIPYQSASGTTTFLASGTGVLVNSAGNPSYTMTPSLTQVTVAGNPSAALEVATKQYVDNLVSSGITYHTPVKYEVPNSTGNLNALYNQPGGAGVGVGATLTNNGTKAAFAPDGPTASVGDRILVYNQTNAFENGVYTVTTVGTPDPGGTNWVLTRATDADTYGLKDPNSLGNGDAFFITSGDTGAGETYVVNTVGTITFGTTSITFVQVSDSTLYTAGNGLQLTSGTVFSLIAPVTTVNGGTGLTSFTSGGAVYATSTSALTTGTLPATAGGTGQSSYAVGDLLYASTTSALSSLADVATGNALISGGINTAPSWGKIGLTTHVSGTLPVGNGGTGATTLTANGVLLGNGTSAISATAVGSTGQVLVGNTGAAPTWAALSSSAVTSFSAGTTGFTPSSTTTGAITLAGTLNVANGGTGATSLTSGYLLKGNGTSAVSASIVYDNGTQVGIGTTSPTSFVDMYAVTGANLNVRGDGGVNISGIRSSTDASGPNMVMRKARGTSASPTAVASGDNMGTLFFSAYGGANNRNIASIAGTVDTFYSDTGIGSYLTFSTTPNGSVTIAERMRIDSSGNVGIGTAAPATTLDVATGFIQLSSGATARSKLFADASVSTLTAEGARSLVFATNGAERARIDSSGNVGIGTSSPSSRLDVNSLVTLSGGESSQLRWLISGKDWRANAAAGGNWYMYDATNNKFPFTIEGNTPSDTFRLTSSGNVGIGTSSPTTRLTISQSAGSVAGGQLLVKDPSYSGVALVQGATGEGYLWNIANSYLSIGTNSTERMRITAAGNVGIGTSSPGYKFEVTGQTLIGNGIAQAAPSTTDIASTSHVIVSGQGGNALFFGQYPGAQGYAQWIQSSFLNPTTATYNLILQPLGGNVGIGTSSPGALLQLNKASGSVDFRLSVGGTLYTNMYASASDTSIYAVPAIPLILGTNNTERMRITSGGDIGIGVSTPGSRLDVRKVAGATAVVSSYNSSTTGNVYGYYSDLQSTGNSTSSYHFAGVTQGVNIWYLYGNGSSSWSSDQRLKKNIGATRDGYLDDLCKLRVVKYNWRTDAEDKPRELGLIAQEVEEVFPGLVEEALHTLDETEIKYKVLKGSVLPYMLLKALQEASTKIDELSARVAQLEGN